MDFKQIGKWAGGIVGSFVVLLILVYFLFPYINPKKAAKVEKAQQSKINEASFGPATYTPKTVDSLNLRISSQQMKIDSLHHTNKTSQQVIDSLKKALKGKSNESTNVKGSLMKDTDGDSIAIKKASQSLLRLDEKSLRPIVNLLGEHELLSLYEQGSSRQREKLLRTLSPKKAAKILKKVMQ